MESTRISQSQSSSSTTQQPATVRYCEPIQFMLCVVFLVMTPRSLLCGYQRLFGKQLLHLLSMNAVEFLLMHVTLRSLETHNGYSNSWDFFSLQDHFF